MNEQIEKKLDELISRTIDSGKPQFDMEKWKQKYPQEFHILQSRAVKSPVPQTNIWRTIMERRIIKLAAAAVIIAAAGITIAVLNRTESTDVKREAVQIAEKPADQSEEQAAAPAVTKVAAANPKLEAELKQVEQMFAARNVDGLVKMLSEGQFETKVAAANFLAQVGDLNSVPILEQLNNEYGSNEPAFANAIIAIQGRTVTSPTTQGTEGASDTNTQGTALAQSSGTIKKTADELLQLVPGNSLFCVRVSNFDSTFGKMDQFLAGVSPVPAGATMGVRMLLVGALGDPALNNVKTSGNFAIFGMSLPDASGNELMKNLFVGVLVPVTDYTKFISDNQNCSQPDANGVSIIKCGGTINPNKKTLVTQVTGYALLSSSNAYDKLISTAKSISTGSSGLGSTLDANEVKIATKEPLWAYVNIQRASKVFGPVLTGKLEEMKKEIEKLNTSKQGGPTPAAMNWYFGMLDILMKEVKSASITIKPQVNVCNMTMNISAVPDTYMARMFASGESSGTENNLLGYLQDGAIFNVGVKMNTPFWEEWNLSNFDLLFCLDEGNDVSDDTAEKVEKLIADMIASSGGPGVISCYFDEKNKLPFVGQCVFAVKDAERWSKAQEGFMELWNTSGFAKTYRKLGMETNYEITHGTDTYRSISIDSAKFSMRAVDANSDYGKVIDQIYSGIDYRWATVDGLHVTIFGGDCNSAIYDLIDEVKAGGPEQISGEMQAALSALTEAAKSEFVGTFNYVRMLKMAAAITPKGGALMTPQGGVPQIIDIPTNSNIAFDGKVGNGKLTVEIALPKEHLMELKAAFEAMQKAMAEAMQAAKEAAAKKKAASEANEPNNAGQVDVVTEQNEP